MANSTTSSLVPSSSQFSRSKPEIFDSALFIWPLGVAFCTGAIASIFGNIMILKALAISPELRKNRCNMLVANLAIADLFHAAYFLVFGLSYIVANIIGLAEISMSQETCFYIFIPGLLAVDSSSLTVLAIGVDRVVSLARPAFYRNLTATYIYWTIGISWSIGVLNELIGLNGNDAHEIVAACAAPVALKGAAYVMWIVGIVTVDILVVFAYALAYWKAKELGKVRSISNESTLKNNRLLTSLITFVSVYISSILIGNVIVALSNVVTESTVVRFHVEVYAGLLVVVSTGCNFYIYYARSEEYRSVFRKILRLKPLVSGNNRIVPTGG